MPGGLFRHAGPPLPPVRAEGRECRLFAVDTGLGPHLRSRIGHHRFRGTNPDWAQQEISPPADRAAEPRSSPNEPARMMPAWLTRTSVVPSPPWTARRNPAERPRSVTSRPNACTSNEVLTALTEVALRARTEEPSDPVAPSEPEEPSEPVALSEPEIRRQARRSGVT